MENQTTIDRIFDHMAAAILEHNDLCADQRHMASMRRTVLDQLELGKRRIKECLSSE